LRTSSGRSIKKDFDLENFLNNAFKIAEKVAAIIKIEIMSSRLNMRAIITHVNLVLSVI
jgi:hypothetical protein